jgi:hypothetical protein
MRTVVSLVRDYCSDNCFLAFTASGGRREAIAPGKPSLAQSAPISSLKIYSNPRIIEQFQERANAWN